MVEPINIESLEPIEVPVNLGGEKYVLREASGEVAVRYRNRLLACTQLGPDGTPTSVQGMANVEPYLISQCLYDSENKLVPESLIRSWPSRVQTLLFDNAKEISDLDETPKARKAAEEAAKNALKSTEDGST